ncbi:MAG: hypothetical protein WC359_12455 [Dehalococcoidia bacterium]
MINIAGYLVNARGGLRGDPGLGYDYIMASNGLFIRASNKHLAAQIRIAPAEVRGLAPLERKVELLHGLIPRPFYDLAVNTMYVSSERETYFAVTWEGQYRLRMPSQQREAAHVEYTALENTVMDIHSHGAIPGYHSMTDSKDEQGFVISMVVGRLDTLLPEIKFRLSVYGYYYPLEKWDIFGG